MTHENHQIQLLFIWGKTRAEKGRYEREGQQAKKQHGEMEKKKDRASWVQKIIFLSIVWHPSQFDLTKSLSLLFSVWAYNLLYVDSLLNVMLGCLAVWVRGLGARNGRRNMKAMYPGCTTGIVKGECLILSEWHQPLSRPWIINAWSYWNTEMILLDRCHYLL